MRDEYKREVLIVCPFYKHSDSNHIKCEGFCPGTSITINFSNPQSENGYKDRYCRSMIQYHDCPICEILEEKYADDGK